MVVWPVVTAGVHSLQGGGVVRRHTAYSGGMTGGHGQCTLTAGWRRGEKAYSIQCWCDRWSRPVYTHCRVAAWWKGIRHTVVVWLVVTASVHSLQGGGMVRRHTAYSSGMTGGHSLCTLTAGWRRGEKLCTSMPPTLILIVTGSGCCCWWWWLLQRAHSN